MLLNGQLGTSGRDYQQIGAAGSTDPTFYPFGGKGSPGAPLAGGVLEIQVPSSQEPQDLSVVFA